MMENIISDSPSIFIFSTNRSLSLSFVPTNVGAAISRPKSFDFADVFYKSYRIIVPIIRAANSRPYIGRNETER